MRPLRIDDIMGMCYVSIYHGMSTRLAAHTLVVLDSRACHAESGSGIAQEAATPPPPLQDSIPPPTPGSHHITLVYT